MKEHPAFSKPTSPFPCTECAAGVMHLQHITYFTWLGEELITVPNFPAWVCDMCGRREYDERAISWLTMKGFSSCAGPDVRTVHICGRRA